MGKGKKGSYGEGRDRLERKYGGERDYGEQVSNHTGEQEEQEEDEANDGEVENYSFPVGLYMWEFGQNDPKR